MNFGNNKFRMHFFIIGKHNFEKSIENKIICQIIV